MYIIKEITTKSSNEKDDGFTESSESFHLSHFCVREIVGKKLVFSAMKIHVDAY